MKATELRIGNYVYDRGGKVIKIDFFEHLEKDHDCKFGQNGIVDPEWGRTHPLTEYTEYAKPIPLTEEWLLEFGFEKGQNYYSLKGFDIDDKGWIGFNNMVADCKIKYVHQLQNLYFALTGKELEANP